MALKGKQHKLDKNKDGKISGIDFKMMKARYGVMAKGDVTKGLEDSAKKQASVKMMNAKIIKKMTGAAISESEAGKIKKMLPKISDSKSTQEAKYNALMKKLQNKSKGGTMVKARVGKMIDDTEELGRVDAEKAYTKKGKKNLEEEKKRLVKEIKTEKARVGKIIKASQGYNARLDESLGMRNKNKSQSFKARRDESKGMEKAMGKGAYSGASTMAKKGKMIKANKGQAISTRGYGAARTSGMGLQDESLKPGQSYVIKGGDYIKDLL